MTLIYWSSDLKNSGYLLFDFCKCKCLNTGHENEVMSIQWEPLSNSVMAKGVE